jgi:Fe-S cluster assembly scaffold protein SufB
MAPKQFLESKGIFSLDTKKRTQEVYDWLEEYKNQECEAKDKRIAELEKENQKLKDWKSSF